MYRPVPGQTYQPPSVKVRKWDFVVKVNISLYISEKLTTQEIKVIISCSFKFLNSGLKPITSDNSWFFVVQSSKKMRENLPVKTRARCLFRVEMSYI